MSINHTNRKGDEYFLHQGQTPTGKPRYHFSKKKTGTLCESIPEGYEVYEKPNGQVYLRLIVPRNILPSEITLVEAGIRKHAGLEVFILDSTPDAIEIYLPNNGEDMSRELAIFDRLRLNAARLKAYRWHGAFSAEMRFVLVDREKNLFTVERWCCRGGTDRWLWLKSGTLEDLVPRYTRHLGTESFFELNGFEDA